MGARHETDGSGSAGFLVGLVTGAAIGGALALLFAPKRGSEFRQDLADGVGDLGQAAQDKWNDVAAVASSAATQGREAYDQARKTAQHAIDDAVKSADHLTHVGTKE